MNLVLAETLIAVFGLPVDFLASYYYGWKMGKSLCVLTGFILSTSGELSIATLAVLSIQRLLTILDGNTYKITTYSSAFFIIASIWAYALCLSLPPFFGFGKYVVESSGMTCAPGWERAEELPYTLYWLFLGFLIPLTVIVLSSFKTIRCLNEIRKQSSEPVKRMSKKRDSKVTVLVVWMNVAFLTVWMPYGIICLCYIFGGKGFVNPLIVVIPLLTSKSSVCWNPLLYIVMNFQFRGAFRRLFSKNKHGRNHSRRLALRERKVEMQGRRKVHSLHIKKPKKSPSIKRRVVKSLPKIAKETTNQDYNSNSCHSNLKIISKDLRETANASQMTSQICTVNVHKTSSFQIGVTTSADIHKDTIDVNDGENGLKVQDSSTCVVKYCRDSDSGIIYEVDSISKRSLDDSQISFPWKAHVVDHYNSPNKFINALNLRKTSVYV